MKTNCIFETTDFINGRGQIVMKNSDTNFGDDKDLNLLALMFKVGYIYDSSDPENPPKYCLISMSDGHVEVIGTLGKLIQSLNDNDYRPGKRSEIARGMKRGGNKFKKLK